MERNHCNFNPRCRVHCAGYKWGQDTTRHLSMRDVYPLVTAMTLSMSDLLHFDSSHPVLVTTLTSLLVKSADAWVYVAAGKYTAQNICDNFFNLASDAGIDWMECTEASYDSQMHIWKGTL
ncbi:uncharacterized protein EDB91DRAFT_1043772 [Suillus paluster]|uniref:uncharacterized protein n=1 Tax=Suillus paluster TaxID=48578 RepID=UPI001B871786|nr:uncharacterized protein EDB91DRAFT_1043772 [Suillus paluster]KAG1753518.1 hypothetical protein EDB91DRAFT_1043772 [Suillus paluster]